jgi:hypothetical protein
MVCRGRTRRITDTSRRWLISPSCLARVAHAAKSDYRRLIANTGETEPRVSRRLNARFLWEVLIAAVAAILSACAGPPAPPPNPFVGTWATPDNDLVTIRQDTVVEHRPNGQSTPLDAATCNGSFSFTFGASDRRALTGLLPRQPNLEQDLFEMLPAQTYPVAMLRCDRGDHTYVLLNNNQLLAIYRDGDIGVVERLARR